MKTETVTLETDTYYYQGQVKPNTNIKQGQGVLIDKMKMTQYTGGFQDNLKWDKKAKLIALEKSNDFKEYSGGFEKDLFHGLGVLRMKGLTLKGNFRYGLSKDGILEYPSGEEYVGSLNSQMQREGYGVLKYSSGDQYCGDFHSDLRHGKGVLKKLNGDQIEGVWCDDKLTMGQQQYPDGVYFGSFDDQMLPSGKGIFKFCFSDAIYQGSWREGL